VHLGVSVFSGQLTIAPQELAPMVEERGFESLWVPEHSHIPVSRESPFPRGGELPDHYRRTHDPFVAISMAAAVTTRLKLGFGVCLVAQRDTLQTAKAVASLDLLSGGRVLFGAGGGWNREEMRNHGTDPDTRFRLLRERLRAMKAIWTEEAPEYHGRLVDFDPVWSWPKPLQRPHPPIYLGGGGPNALARVVDLADGWMPIAPKDPDLLLSDVARLRQMAEAAGRREPRVTLYSAPADAETLLRYQEAGIERAVLWLPPAARDVVEPVLDELEALRERLS
jgi:probable F420-dependent oxidoreductase